MAGSTWGLLVFGRLWETCQVMASRHKQAGFESVTGEGERRCEALSLLEPMGMGSSCLLRAELMCAFNHSLSGEKSDRSLQSAQRPQKQQQNCNYSHFTMKREVSEIFYIHIDVTDKEHSVSNTAKSRQTSTATLRWVLALAHVPRLEGGLHAHVFYQYIGFSFCLIISLHVFMVYVC